MANQRSIHYFAESVSFGLHTSHDVVKISKVEVSRPETFNALGHPIANGVYDLHMGPYIAKAGNCTTCHLGYEHCSGHFGHIVLPLPCYHPLFLRNIVSIIKMTCPGCRTFTIPEKEKLLLVGQLQLLKYGLVTEAQNLWQNVKPNEELLDEEEGKTTQLNEDQLLQLRVSIEEEIEKVKQNNGIPCGDNPPLTRNVENLKMELLKIFMQKFFIGKKKCAQGCKGGFEKVQPYKSRIVYSLKHDTSTTCLGGHMMMNDPVELNENSDVEDDKEAKTPSKKKRKPRATLYITPKDARDFLRELWKNEKEFFGQLYPVLFKTNIEHPTDIFFLDVISVMPPKFRPVNVIGGITSDNKQTLVLRKMVTDSYTVKAAIFCCEKKSFDGVPENIQRMLKTVQGLTPLEKLQTAWQNLQTDVNMIVDASSDKESMLGFKQILEKKEGLLRMNMMGKRVNFAARSVITPDPNLDVEEVGVPDCFAKKLTFPTPVTAFNVCEMREAVRNGPNIWPGASHIEESNGKKIILSPHDEKSRVAIGKTLLTPFEACSQAVYEKNGKIRTLFKPKIVHRHLKTGDIMLLNRQPSLHKPSMMAHKARVLMGEKTLRLHYANCKAYNADFDGDEMNAHFPQGEVARSEGYNIVAVPHQYLVPKDGTPLSGLIQDHMIAGVKLTMRGQFFNRADYQQLVFAGLGGREYDGITKLLAPTILKPVPLWSGKQILSSVIINLTPKDRQLINMNSTAKISVKDWQTVKPRMWKAGGNELRGNCMTENEVIIQHGELLVGVLDKMHYGATSYSLVHLFNELYGGRYSCRLLSCLSRLFTTYLQLKGFSLGVEDILVTPNADKKRSKILKRLETVGDGIAAKAVGVTPEELEKNGMDIVRKKMEEVHFSQNAVKKMGIDREYKSITDKINNEVNRACIPGGLHKLFPDNNLALMIQSGAKGSSVNAMQISCLLGQIELEGKRPPMMMSGRSLPSFLAFDTSPRAGGFISGRFMTGIRPQEFFFHCMAGREGLIDTAVKTSRSGYLQRCLVKHLEGVSVAYDGTVRDSDGLVLQFLYGEDGLDICKSQFLNDKGIPFLVANRECVRLLEPTIDESEQKQLDRALKSVRRWLKKHGTLNKGNERKSSFLKFSSQCGIEERNEKGANGRTLSAMEIQNAWLKLSAEERKAYSKKTENPPDPVNAKFSFTRYTNVMDEQLNAIMSRYLDHPDVPIGRKDLTRLVYNKAVAASCEPGEPVGVLAAQSIGEPSTQMTLNTFHFAGRGEMNVTLGIPRLREILMVAAENLNTPSMDIPILGKGRKALKKAEKLKLKLTRVTLADVLENVHVTEGLSIRDGERARIYGLTFNFLPHSSYKDRFCVKPKQVLYFFEKIFLLKVLLPGMKKEADAQSKQSLFECKTVSQARKTAGKEDDETEDITGITEEGEMSNGRTKIDDDENNDSDNGSNANDDDFATQRAKNADEHEYEDEDEVETDKESVDEEGFEEETQRKDQGEEDTDNEESNDRTINEDIVFEVVPTKEEMDPEKEEAYEAHKHAVMDEHSWICDYEFDSTKFLNCTVTLSVPLFVEKVDLSSSLKKWAESTVVHHVPKIKRAFVVAPESDDGDIIIKTDGVNIQAMFQYADVLDLNRLYTNDIHQVVKNYGVEAASRVIVKEVNNVFKVYGITVDPRHLSLVASFMTSGGDYRSFSRHGMADSTSPYQQMSFETATEFLKNATLQGKTDFLKTPSSRLIMGLPGCEGTGSFSLMAKLY